MAIVMIEGPEVHKAVAREDVRAALAERASNAGVELVHVRCEDEAQLLARLESIDRGNADIILLDPGRIGEGDPRLERVLGGL